MWPPQRILSCCFSPAEFYSRLVYQVEELVQHIKVDLEEPFQGKAGIEFPVSSAVCNSSVYTETEYYFNGRCFSFHLPSCILSKGILEMKLSFRKKVDVFIHHPGQYFSPDSRARVDVTPNRSKKIAINHEVKGCISCLSLATTLRLSVFCPRLGAAVTGKGRRPVMTNVSRWEGQMCRR